MKISKIHGRVLRSKQRGYINPHLLMMSGAGYQVQNSLRFRGSANAFLSRTFAAGDQQKWTFSFWFKGWTAGVQQNILQGGGAGGSSIYKGSDDALHLTLTLGSPETRVTSAKYRDPAAFYHVVVAVDSTLATAADRAKIFVNGERVTSFATSNDPVLNSSYVMNSAVGHVIGQSTVQVGGWADGYLADPVFVGGQSLLPSSFGQLDVSTGQWVAKRYAGTYGTNGFYLDFKDPTTTSSLCLDRSGNGNNWTPNNISVTPGVTYDSMIDVPLVAGGGERGNYCVLNAITKQATVVSFLDANLAVNLGSATDRGAVGTIFVSSGKWYFEYKGPGSAAVDKIGVIAEDGTFFGGEVSKGVQYWADGKKTVDGVNSSYGAAYTSSDVIGIALDNDAGSVTFYKNGVSQGVVPVAVRNYSAAISDANGLGSGPHYINFGQRPFAHTPPSGFKALHTGNLPTPTIKRGDDHVDVNLRTGNGTTQTITGKRFSPGLVKNKTRSSNFIHKWTDVARGVTNAISSANDSAQVSDAGGLTAFTADGFTVGSANAYNNNAITFADLMLKAGGAPVANLNGSLASQVSANPTAGVAIVTYSGSGANATVGHGLGIAPAMVIIKRLNGASSWKVYHQNLGPSNYLNLDTTDSVIADGTVFASTAPTSSVFSVGSSISTNAAGGTYVAYCFAEIPGFSKVGFYTGNASADGPFAYTGFKTKWLTIKNVNDNTTAWSEFDTARSPANVVSARLQLDSDATEDSLAQFDIVSNGFKCRLNNNNNTSGHVIIYLALAESPFKYANAR